MTVHLVYRSHYDSPSCRRSARFEDASVLDWFRRIWSLGEAELESLVGFRIYGLNSLPRAIQDYRLPAPADDGQLAEVLLEHLYSEGPILPHPHLLTVQTDDDELEVAYYLFDDHYLDAQPARPAWLLHEGWPLPESVAAGPYRPAEPVAAIEPGGPGEGALYWCCDTYVDSGNLDDLSPAGQVLGVRVPGLARYLAQNDPQKSWPQWWLLLRAVLFAAPEGASGQEHAFLESLQDEPREGAGWAAYSDWLQEQGRPAAGLTLLRRGLEAVTRVPVTQLSPETWKALRRGAPRQARLALDAALAKMSRPARHEHDPAKSQVQVAEGVAQLGLHVANWGTTDLFHRWLFFDDRWAAAYPDLANSLLRYNRTWDVLSPGE